MLYCTAAASLTCLQQRVVYVLAVTSSILALQQIKHINMVIAINIISRLDSLLVAGH